MASAEARRLRRLQWAAQLEVDAVWEPLAREAEAAVLRHAVEVMNSYDDPDGASS